MDYQLKTFDDLHSTVKKNYISGKVSFQGKLTANKGQIPATFQLFHDKLELYVGSEKQLSLSYQDNPTLQVYIHLDQKDLVRIDISDDSSLQFLCKNSSERYIFTKTFQMFKFFGDFGSFDETFALNQTILGKTDELNAIALRSVNEGGIELKGLFAKFKTGSKHLNEKKSKTTIIFKFDGIDFQTKENPTLTLKWNDKPKIKRDQKKSQKLLISLNETKIKLKCSNNDQADLIFECFTFYLQSDQFKEQLKSIDKTEEKTHGIELELEKESDDIPENIFFVPFFMGKYQI